MYPRKQRRVEAYVDGALSERDRTRVERQVQVDTGCERHLRQTRALGAIVRDAWTEGPPAPPVEQWMPALRREMARIDAERASVGEWSSWRSRWRALWGSLDMLPAGAATAAVGLALALYLWPTSDVPQDLLRAEAPSAASQAAEQARRTINGPARAAVPATNAVTAAVPAGGPASVYDLAQGETPLLLLEAEDGSTIIWLLESDELSRAHEGKGWA